MSKSHARYLGLLYALAILILLVGMVALPTLAAPMSQGINLLQNPSLEDGSLTGWQSWSYDNIVYDNISHRSINPNQSFYHPYFTLSEHKWDKESLGKGDVGAAAEVSGVQYTKFRGGFFQTVNVARGSFVRFGVWVNGLCENDKRQRCPVLLRAGIDPEGGTDWQSSNIRWVETQISEQDYQLLTPPDVQVGPGGRVTVFVWGEPLYASLYNAAYFDEASLIVTIPPTPTGAAPTAPLPPPTAAPCAQMRFLADVMTPENSLIKPGAQFTRKWRVQNSGTCAWSGTLAFIGSGAQMGGASPTTLPRLEVGQTLDISLDLTAPTQPGSYQGTWEARTDDGIALGRLLVKINATDATATPISASTATSSTAIPKSAVAHLPATTVQVRGVETVATSRPTASVNMDLPSAVGATDNTSRLPVIIATAVVIAAVVSLAVVSFKRKGF